ncbi:MAG: general secretion pathway protein GspD [Hydrogenophaga sp.]|uniref:secretin N-terminal domain-containing protein n=1 Tax=Hydrogenophaga sp. TaxID=1904254 RepID=UPI0016971ACD|nr:secretin N-terminal domain-containing protein [Hydrogenophaga sp.]NIM40580.1 general secretion pathway protein GspD [Hydrogenophaga sp.]NIN25998.1 general secretion pathway protein GspD [Hydrogenophaga sp.]NIN30870.1 general secretion pathway protein GspD [Hydrogenophaga sp.]NIN54963.1 general secretion pathway protein GspD [Hydrogenophaga sp.]NIO51003.1 general secretion pathway protein GspD [Hydrogenophaga sp.]
MDSSIACRLWMGVLGLVLLTGCAQQMLRDKASAQMREGQYEAAISTLSEGVNRYAESALLRAGLASTRAEAMARLVAQATQERMDGRFDAAQASLERAQSLEPGSPRIAELLETLKASRAAQSALQEAQRQRAAADLVGALHTLNRALVLAPREPDLLALKREVEREERLQGGHAIKLSLGETRPISLDFRNVPLGALLEAIRDGSGVNFVIDRDVKVDQRASIFIRSARLEDAIDLVLSAFNLSRRIVDPSTVLVYPNTMEKHKEHREQVVRVFHLSHAQAKTTATLLQSMLRVQPPFVDERANLIAMRDSPEVIALAERLVALHDMGEAEVMLDVEVLEVKTTRLTELGLNFPNSVTLTPLPLPGQTTLTVDSLRSINSSRVGVSVAGLLINLRREVGDFNTLANPRIRSRSREKATILIGDKVPVITTTAASSGFVSENVNYLDVGLKLEVEPIVSPDDEVTIKLGLEVSSLAGEVRSPGGTLAYQIGTRNANTMLRLRDGETQILGGLISNEDRRTANRVPGLGDLPIAGRLFSSQKDDANRTELVLAITPRILRSAARVDVASAEMWVGTENFTRPQLPAALRTAADRDAMRQAAAPSASPSGQAPAARDRDTSEPQQAPPSGVTVGLRGPEQVKVGDVFTVAVQVAAGQAITGLPMDLRFPADRLEILGVIEGGFFKRSSAPSSFTHAVNPTEGRVSVGLLSNAPQGVRGTGEAVLLRVRAKAAGEAQWRVQTADAQGPNGVVTDLQRSGLTQKVEP